MKKYLFIILLVFLLHITNAYPWLNMGPNQPAAGGVDNYCDSCPDATAGADLLCEDFNTGGAAGICSWTVVETGGADGDINMAGTPDDNPALGCTDIDMTYAGVVTKTSANSGRAYALKDISDTDNKYVQFYVKFTAWTIASGEYVNFASLKDAAGDPSVYLRVYNSSGTYKLNALIYHDDYISDTQFSGGITLDTWIGIRFKVLNPTGTDNDYFRWWTDLNNDGSFTDQSGGGDVATNWSRTMDRMMIGITEATTNQMTFQISGFKVDDDTMPTGCTK